MQNDKSERKCNVEQHSIWLEHIQQIFHSTFSFIQSLLPEF